MLAGVDQSKAVGQTRIAVGQICRSVDQAALLWATFCLAWPEFGRGRPSLWVDQSCGGFDQISTGLTCSKVSKLGWGCGEAIVGWTHREGCKPRNLARQMPCNWYGGVSFEMLDPQETAKSGHKCFFDLLDRCICSPDPPEGGTHPEGGPRKGHKVLREWL